MPEHKDHIFRKCVDRTKQKTLTTALDSFFEQFNASDATTAYTRLEIARILTDYALDIAKAEAGWGAEAQSLMMYLHDELSRKLQIATHDDRRYQTSTEREVREYLWKAKLN